MTICELSYVFLLQECSSGTYGKDCTKNCSGYCLHNKSCNHIDVACADGCQNGYIGNICNTCKMFCKYSVNVFFYWIFIINAFSSFSAFNVHDHFSMRTRALRQELFTHLFLKLQDMQTYWRYMQLLCRLEWTQL